MQTAVKERPILFSGPMVRAILEGRKTQTRRVVKPGCDSPILKMKQSFGPNCADWSLWYEKTGEGVEPNFEFLKCPYGKPGDRLWVRESYWIVEREGQGVGNPFLLYEDEMGREPDESAPYRHAVGMNFGHKPSIHMPRWASRIQLEVTDVRVERLQDISEEDALSEGIDGWCPYERCGGIGFIRQDPELPDECRCGALSYPETFQKLWESINGAPSWQANPFVWVIEFKKLEKTNG